MTQLYPLGLVSHLLVVLVFAAIPNRKEKRKIKLWSFDQVFLTPHSSRKFSFVLFDCLFGGWGRKWTWNNKTVIYLQNTCSISYLIPWKTKRQILKWINSTFQVWRMTSLIVSLIWNSIIFSSKIIAYYSSSEDEVKECILLVVIRQWEKEKLKGKEQWGQQNSQKRKSVISSEGYKFITGEK